MSAFKLSKSVTDALRDSITGGTGPHTLKLSSRMLANPDEGLSGTIILPLTNRQMAKLLNSKRSTNFNLSRSQLNKMKKGSGIFGDIFHGIGKAASFVGNKVLAPTFTHVIKPVASEIGKQVIPKVVDAAIAAAPALILAGAGTAGKRKPAGKRTRVGGEVVGVSLFAGPRKQAGLPFTTGSGTAGKRKPAGKPVPIGAGAKIGGGICSNQWSQIGYSNYEGGINPPPIDATFYITGM